MGMEYQRWLIAKGNVFAPGAASIVKLVEKLREAGFLPGASLAGLRYEGARAKVARETGAYAARTVENEGLKDISARLVANLEPLPKELTPAWLDDPSREELRLVWPVTHSGDASVAYPLTRRPEGEVSYTLEIHRAPDYVYPVAETIDLLDTTCPCGEELEFEWDEDELVPAFAGSNGIFAECEACSRTFDPAKGTAAIQNPFDDEDVQDVRGGAAYRFALKVDCGKSFVDDASLAFAPELVALVEKEFGRAFYEVGALL